MEQHPVPQQISSYQFRLVGDMTVKQFLQVGGGALVGLLIYATGLPGIIRWPLIIFSGGFGAALAFLPFQERPLGQWIVAYFKAIYSPTLFTWQKPQKPTQYFKSEATQTTTITSQKESTPIGAPGFTSPSLVSLEEAEDSFLSRISHLFKSAPTTQPTTPKIPAKQTSPQKLKIPQSAPVQTVAKQTGPRRMVVEEQGPITPVNAQTVPVGKTLVSQMLTDLQAAQFSPEAAPPSPPTIPNTISGQVMDLEGKIVEAAILEIKDSAGRPMRALRSNKAGHFLIVTALPNGKYQLLTEKEGLVFDPVSFEAQGEIVPPISVRSKTKIGEAAKN